MQGRKSGFEAIEEDLISASEWGPMSKSTSSFAKLMHLESEPVVSPTAVNDNEAIVEGDGSEVGQGDFTGGKTWEQLDSDNVIVDNMDANDSTVLTGSERTTTTRL